MNINEIAKLAGVSRATVSRYLNNGYVSAEKKEKLREIIASTGYTPSSFAQTLRTNKTGTVGIIVPKISSESVSRMVDGITAILSQKGYHPLLGNTDQDRARELEYLNVFQNRQVDGILLIATVLTPKHEKAIRNLSTPIVVLGQETKLCPCVCYDDYGAALGLTQLLLSQGRQQVGYIGVDPIDRAAGLSRKNGYLAAFTEAGRSPDMDLVREGEFSVDSGFRLAGDLLDRRPALDGIFCATDNIAAGAMLCLRERGRHIPEVAVCGVGDSQIARLLTPSLTSAHLHYKTGGEEAAHMLLDMLDGRDGVNKMVRLECTLAVRDSTGNE